jgi:ketosteroid isomerase-like protein
MSIDTTGDDRAEIVKKTWTAWCAGDLETALRSMADDITWTIPGTRDVSGRHEGKDAMRQLFAEVHGMFPDGLQVDFHELHATRDSVVAEMTIKGPAFNGRHYENAYCIVFGIEKHEVQSGRVYVDMTEVARVFDT